MIRIAHAEAQPGSGQQLLLPRLIQRGFAQGSSGLLRANQASFCEGSLCSLQSWRQWGGTGITGTGGEERTATTDGCIVFFLLQDQRPWGNKKHHFHASRTHQHVLSGNMSLKMLWVTFLAWRYHIVGRFVPWLRFEVNPRGQARGSSCQRQLLQGPVTFPASPLLAGANGRVPSPVIAAKTTVVTVITGTTGFPMTTVANRRDSTWERDSRGLPLPVRLQHSDCTCSRSCEAASPRI